MLPPNGATFRYASSNSRFEYRASSHSAAAICRSLPAGVFVFSRYISRASCIVSVEPPCRAPPRYVRNAARRERHRIHAGMPVEPAILLQQERVDERRRHPRQRHPQPVLIVGRQRHAQQFAIGGPHAGRQRNALRAAARAATTAARREREARDARRRPSASDRAHG